MKKFAIKFLRSYKKRDSGTTVFIYGLINKADKAAYAAIQGEYHREDADGISLYFSTKYIGERGTLIQTANGKVVPDMSAFDKAASLAEQYGGNFGTELAKINAKQLMLFGNSETEETEEAPAKAPEELEF